MFAVFYYDLIQGENISKWMDITLFRSGFENLCVHKNGLGPLLKYGSNACSRFAESKSLARSPSVYLTNAPGGFLCSSKFREQCHKWFSLTVFPSRLGFVAVILSINGDRSQRQER